MTAAATAPTEAPEDAGLEAGDRMTRAEFERRYEAAPHIKKAELIEGIVYMSSPVRARKHGQPHLRLGRWVGAYEDDTPGVEVFDNTTVRLDLDNEPQPDLAMLLTPEKGGQAGISEDDYIEDAPEFVAEIVASTRSYDLHQKKGAYLRNGVREYLAWIVNQQRIVWWELHEGEYREIPPDEADGLLKSRVFPGLWLDAGALLRGKMKEVLAALNTGLESAAHREFASR